MGTLEKSDSTTSLSKLNTEEEVCHFCQKESDLEEGYMLVDAKQFLDCKCHITTHLKCWGEYLQQAHDPHIGCPNCQKPIAGWRKRITIDEISQMETEMKDKKYPMIYLTIFILAILITLGLVIVFTLNR